MAADPDLLASAVWECAATLPGEASAPDELGGLPLRWLPASVPGTAAADRARDAEQQQDEDEQDAGGTETAGDLGLLRGRHGHVG